MMLSKQQEVVKHRGAVHTSMDTVAVVVIVHGGDRARAS
jgi:hypothetical protein